MEEYLHDMKEIADLMRRLIAAMDKLFIDVETKKKGEQHGSDNANSRTG